MAILGGRGEELLWVDPRYTLQARKEAIGLKVVEVRQGLLKAAGAWLEKKRAVRAGCEESHLTWAALKGLRSACQKVSFKPCARLIEELRSVKDAGEVELIRRAAKITSAALADVRPLVRPGTREMDLAAEIEYCMRRRGAEGAAFETIVASGARSAWAHARPTSNLLKKRDLVILDLGAILRGYAADMTRTLYLGRPSPHLRRLYSAVKDAQAQAIGALRAGVLAGEIDQTARRVLNRYGVGKYFTHSTGHGVGLETHERPRLGRGERQQLEAGCVVTVEPGVYVQRLGGIRIEDTVLVAPDGPEMLTESPKDDWIVP